MKGQGLLKWYITLACAGIIILLVMLSFAHYHKKQLLYNPQAKPAQSIVVPVVCPKQNFFILALDGGGTRGVITLYFLAQLERLTGKPISQLFDLVSGISTGSIIGSVLLMPGKDKKPAFTANQLTKLYFDNSGRIFDENMVHKVFSLDGLIGPKFPAQGRQTVLNEYYRNLQMGHLLTHAVFYGYDAVNKKIVAFCSWKGCGDLGKTYKLKHIIMGTTAIMALFPSKVFVNNQNKATAIVNDVTFSINNPSILAYKLAKKMCPSVKHYVILSLGTGFYPGINKVGKNAAQWGVLSWLPRIVTTSGESQLQISNEVMKLLMEHVNKKSSSDSSPRLIYIRINPAIKWGAASPIDTSKKHLKNLLNAAKDYERHHQELLICVADLLKSKKLTEHCKKILVR